MKEKQFIVTWTVTLNAADADRAVQRAQALMDNNDVSPEVEEIDEADEVSL